MKKIILFALTILFCVSLFAKDIKMWIAVEDAPLKESSSAFSKTITTLHYGAQVVESQTKGSWSFVTYENTSGWISTASLSKRKIIAKDKNFSADADELALAGKGFNAEVENEYKKSGKADYDAVDKVEQLTVSDEELLEFIIEGKLQGAEQ